MLNITAVKALLMANQSYSIDTVVLCSISCYGNITMKQIILITVYKT